MKIKNIILSVILGAAVMSSSAFAGDEDSIKAAIIELKIVQVHLTAQAASDDKGGLVVEALDNVKAAIAELKKIKGYEKVGDDNIDIKPKGLKKKLF